MSDAVQVALITSVCNLLIVVVARWMSHTEHKKTSTDMSELKLHMMNGKNVHD